MMLRAIRDMALSTLMYAWGCRATVVFFSEKNTMFVLCYFWFFCVFLYIVFLFYFQDRVIVKVSTLSFLMLILYRGNLIPVLSKHVIKNAARKIR